MRLVNLRRSGILILWLVVGWVSITAGTAAALAAPADEATAGPDPYAVAVWERWEQTLISTRTYANPYADVTLSVTYTGPRGQVVEARGFWDGEDVFKLRFMFPEPGIWQWSTVSSDPANSGLHQQSGSVEVHAYDGDNPLYERGYLRVSSDQRFLTYGDETPFFWLADTAWGAPTNATQAEWEQFVDNRRSKGFTVILVSIANDFTDGGDGVGGTDLNGNAPFFGDAPDDLAKWNPDFWHAYERKVQYANDQGLVVAIIGVAQPRRILVEPDESPALQHFARSLAARFLGNFVVYAQQYDRPYMEVVNEVGYALREVAPTHLITNHPPLFEDRNDDGVNDSILTAEDYYDQPYLDFSGNQSGAGWIKWPVFENELAARYAIEWNLRLYNRTPHKPVIVSESVYDSSIRHDREHPYHTQVRTIYLPRMARSAAYWSLLSGSAGYSFGVGQTFCWGPRDISGQAGDWDWATALDMPSSYEMMVMKAFFSSLDWWRLVPAHDLILNQPDRWIDRMVLSKTADGDLAVAYLPDNREIVIDMTAFPTTMHAWWFNPVSDEIVDTDTVLSNRGRVGLARPNGWSDAVLLLKSSPTGAGTVAMPIISPGSGYITEPVAVRLSTATPGATLYYSLDGTVPSADSILYTAPFTIAGDALVRAIATAPGYHDSASVYAFYFYWNNR